MRRFIISAVLFATAGVVVPAAQGGAATANCPAEKICLWNQPNFTGKMIVQEGGRCQRPPAETQFGPIRSVQNRTTIKQDGGQWYLRTWSADDCNCSRTCATQWNAEIRAGQERSNLNPGQNSYEAVFIEPDCPNC
jgi:Peptidase inhibitor family I36